MDIIKNKYEVITLDWIANYIDELYEPYKVYDKPELLRKNTKLYNTPKGNYDDKLEILNIVYNGKDSYAIYKPTSNEIDKIKMFREIEYKWSKLIELRNLQIEFLNKNLKKQQEIEIENRIDTIINEIFVVDKKNDKKNEIALIDKVFKNRDKFTDVLEILEKRKIIIRNGNLVECLKLSDYPSLARKKLIGVLFNILTQRGYLQSRVSDVDIVSFIKENFNLSITKRYYGQIKNDLSLDYKKSKLSDYFDFLHFIPENK
ncbi:MAG: hypothetical protein LCH35_07355 [Bacteroidetes bacterium]|uniref:hypothetical protein n=1 Tax=Flavobacterium sp. TaxID=239 RepID=UPI002FDACEFD|nr:hypothetical protein [Bacteroidota bacterium]